MPGVLRQLEKTGKPVGMYRYFRSASGVGANQAPPPANSRRMAAGLPDSGMSAAFTPT